MGVVTPGPVGAGSVGHELDAKDRLGVVVLLDHRRLSAVGSGKMRWNEFSSVELSLDLVALTCLSVAPHITQIPLGYGQWKSFTKKQINY